LVADRRDNPNDNTTKTRNIKMSNINSHTPTTGHKFFYVETQHGLMCSFEKTFEDVWFQEDLESEDPTEGPEDSTVSELIEEVNA